MKLTEIVETAAQAVALIQAELPKEQKEERVFVLPLDATGTVLSKPVLVAVGHKDSTADVSPKLVFRAAFKAGADSIIVAHNHPSGDLRPSKADLELTNELKLRAEWLGLEFLDHIIIGGFDSNNRLEFTSLAEML